MQEIVALSVSTMDQTALSVEKHLHIEKKIVLDSIKQLFFLISLNFLVSGLYFSLELINIISSFYRFEDSFFCLINFDLSFIDFL